MFARINFLFSVALLAALGFHFAGRFVVVPIAHAIAPALAPYAAGALWLIALMLVVQTLSMTMSGLENVTMAARKRPPAPLGYLGQIVMCAGHVLAGYGLYAFFAAEGQGASVAAWLLAAAVYAVGLAGTLADWRRRAIAGGT